MFNHNTVVYKVTLMTPFMPCFGMILGPLWPEGDIFPVDNDVQDLPADPH
jgi:hypothetical protein